MTTATVEEAIAELVNLGVTGSIDIGTMYDPDLILGWCRWAKERREHGQQVGTGLIVRNIRGGERPPLQGPSDRTPKVDQLREKFGRYARRLPVGGVVESHQRLHSRRWPDDELDCGGALRAFDVKFPVVAVECDKCGFTAAYTARSLPAIDRE